MLSMLLAGLCGVLLLALYFRPRPRPRGRILIAIGPPGVELMSFTIKPGQTRTLTAVFSDEKNVVRPLASLPTATDPTNTLTIVTLAEPTLTDPQYQWSITAPDAAVVGMALQIKVHADGDADPAVDPLDSVVDGVVIAPEDTHVTLSVS